MAEIYRVEKGSEENQRTREFFSKMHIMAQPEYVI